MFRREDRNGSMPFHNHDDNKYAKTPFSAMQSKSRRRLRKRHAVIVLCLLTVGYVMFRSSYSPTSTPLSRRTSVQGQADKKLVGQMIPQGSVVLSEEAIAAAALAAAEKARKKAEEKRAKKKKKAPPTLFEYQDPREAAKEAAKKKAKDKKKAAPVPVKVEEPAILEDLPIWEEQEEELDDSNPLVSDRDPQSLPDSGAAGSGHDQGQGQRLPSYDRGFRKPGAPNSALWEQRKNRVKEAFQHSWDAYRRDAWGKDEYHPISKYGSNMIRKGQGFTIVDSLDTILLMGLDKEFDDAKDWVENELDFDQDGEVNLFETTIRVLGGLLSAYDQSGHQKVFLTKAVDLADRLMGAFETESGIPLASVHLKERRGVPGHEGGISSTSEVSTLQLEFKYLSYLTGDDRYWKVAEKVMLKMKDMETLDGLVPIYIDPYSGKFHGGEIRLGSRGDSYYEYLIKQYLQTGKQEKVYKEMYDHAIAGVKKHLVGRTIPHHLLFVGEISKYAPGALSPKMDHLVCFLGGTMALASTEGKPLDATPSARAGFTRLQEEDFKMGEELTESCYEMYHQTETGLAPEIVYWVAKEDQLRGKTALQHSPGSDFIINDRDGHNWLRPETVESLFYLWRLTGDEKYRHWGWNIFEAMEKYSKVPSGGFSSIHDIRRSDNIRFSDKMETFFLAETLKYFYLLFGSDDVLPLDKYIFNTEAHPLPIFTPPREFLERTSRLSRVPVSADEVHGETKVDGDEEKRYKDLLSKEDDTVHEGSEDDEEEDQIDIEAANRVNEDEDEEDRAGEEKDVELSADEIDEATEDMPNGEEEESEESNVEVEYEESEGDEGDAGGELEEDGAEGEGEEEDAEAEEEEDEDEEEEEVESEAEAEGGEEEEEEEVGGVDGRPQDRLL